MEHKETEVGRIPSHWNVLTIDEIKADKKGAIAMGPFGSNIKSDNFVDKGVPVIRGANMNAYQFYDDNFVYLTDEKANSLGNSICYRRDIVLTHRGTIGQVGMIPIDSKYPRYVVSQSGMKLTVNEEIVSPEYVFYYLKSRIGQHFLLRNTSQTGVPAIGQPTTSLKEIPIPIPPKDESDAIVNSIHALTSKIHLLRQQNTTLENMAQTLFKRWFVDFEFPNEAGQPYKSSGGAMVASELGEIPEGWRVGSLVDIASYMNGVACQKYPPKSEDDKIPVLKIRELSSGITTNTDMASKSIDKKYLIDNGDVIFSWSGTLLVKIWNGEQCVLNQHLFKVTSDEYPKWFYFWWTKYHLDRFIHIAANKATTMGHIKREHLNESMVKIPPSRMMYHLGNVLDGLLQKTINNHTEIQNLTNLRDTLLPKLMSGEVEVN
ncbi:restriction endonuclease subunit S [Flammeovirga kamogawensis]|uniref:Restriction endonuclease subunit S n=1 Tax=Flammeovirga kamogawensis TaxID=373891 RepID=A0ABX8GTF2_9BACT|nr:restriction endonuclease subunit S [Flammeovirga kamogawensis]MBB6463335.1 type I restriction enzyme S subunit [Flammeovirga kamogawensis]QWG06693.1 restriction endonuclease subunit S [Flammeovirga kamogawensis]TRX68515.1 restriction endonuclease subunit S [Flammeovirga kamogawensis]